MPSYPARKRLVAPLHPGEVAADILDDQRVSPRQAALAMGMTSQNLGKVLNGKGPVTPETALRFGAYFGNGPDLWLRMQGSYDLWHGKKRIESQIKAIKPLGKA